MELSEITVRRALAGDEDAFQSVMEETWGLVFLFIRQRVRDRHHARDLAQDTYLQAYEKRSTVRDEKRFVSWLLTIAGRKVIDAHRRRSARPEVRMAPEDLPPVIHRERAGAQLEQSEENAQLHEVVGELGDRYRTVLILRYWSGLTPSQIARLLDEPEGTIRNRIFRAHAQVRTRLERAQQESRADASRASRRRSRTEGRTDAGDAGALPAV